MHAAELPNHQSKRLGETRGCEECFYHGLFQSPPLFRECLVCRMAVVFWIRADNQCIDRFQRGMLAQLAARLQARHTAGGIGEDDGVPVVVDDNCAVW